MERKRTAGVAAVIVGTVLLGIGLWWRKHPSACPYGLRYSLELPHPFLTRSRLR